MWQIGAVLNNLERNDVFAAISYKVLDAHSAIYQIHLDSR